MKTTIRFYLTLKDAPETLELIEGICGSVDVDYDEKHPLNEDGTLMDDVWTYKHIQEVKQRLIEDFIEVKYKEIKNDETI